MLNSTTDDMNAAFTSPYNRLDDQSDGASSRRASVNSLVDHTAPPSAPPEKGPAGWSTVAVRFFTSSRAATPAVTPSPREMQSVVAPSRSPDGFDDVPVVPSSHTDTDGASFVAAVPSFVSFGEGVAGGTSNDGAQTPAAWTTDALFPPASS